MTVDLNASIAPIIDSVVELLPSLVNLVVGIVPVVIAVAVIDLITGLFGGIVSKMRI